MNSLYLSFSVVFPLFFMMALGYILKLVGILHTRFLKELNQLCFLVFLPFILFQNIYQSDFFAVFSLKLVVFAITSVFTLFALLIFLIPKIEKDNRKRSVIVQGIFRSNFILFGIPITASLYGPQNTSSTALLIAFIIPLFNLLSVITLQHFSTVKVKPLTLIKNILTNPLIIASLIAFGFILTGIKLPSMVNQSVSNIAQVATPLALITLGGSFTFKSLTHAFKQLRITVMSKLLILPLLFIPISLLAGFKDAQLIALVALFSSPTAVSTYTMAQSADADDILASQIVVISSILSIFSLFIIITLLKTFSLI